jgi:hypothetical protein
MHGSECDPQLPRLAQKGRRGCAGREGKPRGASSPHPRSRTPDMPNPGSRAPGVGGMPHPPQSVKCLLSMTGSEEHEPSMPLTRARGLDVRFEISPPGCPLRTQQAVYRDPAWTVLSRRLGQCVVQCSGPLEPPGGHPSSIPIPSPDLQTRSLTIRGRHGIPPPPSARGSEISLSHPSGYPGHFETP